MVRVAIFFFCLGVLLPAFGQKHPLTKSDSGIILRNLEKYQYLSEKNDIRGASGALNDVAFIFWNKNHYEEAAKYYERSLKMNESIANENGMAMINNNLGMLYADLGKYEESLDAFTKTLAARKSAKEPVGIVSALVNISVVLNNMGRYNESVIALTEALDISREIYDKERMRSVFGMLSQTYERMGNVEKSLQYFELYKTFHEEIQREEVKNVNKELEQARIQRQLAEAENAQKELELLRAELELYKTNEELQLKDSINRTLYSDLSRRQIEIELLERDKQLSDLERASGEAERQQLQQQRRYLYAILIMVAMAAAIIGTLVVLNVKQNKNHTMELQLKNESIERQREELERANHTKDRIFSVIAHDLRSPISGLQGFFMIIDDLDLSDEVKRALTSVETQLANSAALLDNLLIWSRSQLKNEPPALRSIDIHHLVQESMDLLQFHASQKSISLFNQIPKGASVMADQEMLTIVIRNLIQNAVKFTPEKGKVAVVFEKNGGFGVVRIKDTGVGMDSAKLQSLFDIKTNNSTLGTMKEKGTGLGLILCKELIETMKGSIEVSSDVGKGSVFSLVFTANHQNN